MTIIHTTLAKNPDLNISLLEKYPDEYAIALAGVAMTNINARPPLRVMSIDARSG